MPNIFDHMVGLLAIVVMPLYAYFSFKRIKKRIADGAISRTRLYLRKVIIPQWTIVAALMWLWIADARSWDLLFVVPYQGWRLPAGLAVAFAMLLFTEVKLRKVLGHPDQRQGVTKTLEPVRMILPQTRRELWLWMAVSLTAGCCEEVLFRGFLLRYFETFSHVYVAAALVTVVFAAAHIYQGLPNALRVLWVGAIFMALVLVSDSLWPAVILHAGKDALNGTVLYRLEHAVGS